MCEELKEGEEKFRGDPYGTLPHSSIDFVSLRTVALKLIPNKTDNKRGSTHSQSLAQDYAANGLCVHKGLGSMQHFVGKAKQAAHSYVNVGLLRIIV